MPNQILRSKVIRLAYSMPSGSEKRRVLLNVLADSGRVAAYYGHIPRPPKSPEDEADDVLWHRLRWYSMRQTKSVLLKELGELLRTNKTPAKAVIQWFKDHGFQDPKDYKFDLGKEAQTLRKRLLDIAAHAAPLDKKDTVRALEALMEANDYEIEAAELFQLWLSDRPMPRIDRATRYHYRQVVMPWIRDEFFGR